LVDQAVVAIDLKTAEELRIGHLLPAEGDIVAIHDSLQAQRRFRHAHSQDGGVAES